MAKQDEHKQKGGQPARLGRSVASVPARSSAARTRIVTRPLPPLEAEHTPTPTDKLSPTYEKIRRRQLLIGGAGLVATTLALGAWLWHLTQAIPWPGLP